jgi:hypothetical protein
MMGWKVAGTTTGKSRMILLPHKPSLCLSYITHAFEYGIPLGRDTVDIII